MNLCLKNTLHGCHCGPNKSLLLHGEAVISKHLKIDEEAQTENNFCCMRTILFISCITYLIPIFCATTPPPHHQAVPSSHFLVPSFRFSVSISQFLVPSSQFSFHSSQFTVSCCLIPDPCTLIPVPWSLYPDPCSLFPVH